ncbi:MAG: shikimate kinase [Phycisphaerales bacterium]|nr:shikimate kinase [Phycisphaerales bacterium]
MGAAPIIVLMGLRASGKTTLGRLLAARLGRRFIDLDDLTAARLGAARAGDALAQHGEPAFRAAEVEALRGVLRGGDVVLALGGGTPTARGAAWILREEKSAGRAVCVYLRADAATLRRRLAADPTPRPSLTGKGVAEEVEHLMRVREPIYRDLADAEVPTGGMEPETVVRRIEAALRGGPGGGGRAVREPASAEGEGPTLLGSAE